MQEGWTALHFAADRKFVDALQVFLMVEECDVTICNNVSHYVFMKNGQVVYIVSGGEHILS